MRLGAFIPLKNSNYRNAAMRLKRMGMRNIFLNYDDSWTDEKLKSIKGIFDKSKISIVQVGGYANIIAADKSVRKKSVERLKKAIKAADRLNSPIVATTPGSMNPTLGYGAHKDNFTEKAWEILSEGVEEILKAAEKTEVKFCLEPLLLSTLNSVQKLRKIIDEIKNDKLKILLDPVNLINIDKYFDTGDFLNRLFDLLGNDIAAAHAKDVYLYPDKLTLHIDEVVPGMGNLDYETYLKRLDELDPLTPLLIEHIEEDEDILFAKEYINKVAKKVGIIFAT